MSVAAALDILSGLLVALGVFFAFGGAIGLLRFPDFYTRLHAGGVTDTLGAELILLGLLLQAPTWIVAVKLVIIGFFLFFTSPTATHATAAAAYGSGLQPLTGRWRAPKVGAGRKNDAGSP